LDSFPAIQKSISKIIIAAEFGKDNFKTIIRKIESAKEFHRVSRIHVVVGGPPCQPYSLAGRSRDPDRMKNDNRYFLYEYYLKF